MTSGLAILGDPAPAIRARIRMAAAEPNAARSRKGDAMDLDKTLEFSTSLDRRAIEARLEEVRKAAAGLSLTDVAKPLTGVAGTSREEMARRIRAALAALKGSREMRLIALLELAELNLPNL